jgi:hypothetical protein
MLSQPMARRIASVCGLVVGEGAINVFAIVFLQSFRKSATQVGQMAEVNREGKSGGWTRIALTEATPGRSWYSQYWLEEEPWPDLAFKTARVARRIARIIFAVVSANGPQVLSRIRGLDLSHGKHPARCGKSAARKATHPA